MIFQLCSTDGNSRQSTDDSAVVSEFIAETPLPDAGLPCIQKLQNAQNNLKKVLDSQKRLFSKFNESKEAALNTNIAAISAADLYASLSAIDPTVIDAANFAYTAEIENRPDLIEQFAENNGNTESLDGVVAHLKGYVAEKYVADRLTSQGKNVQFPQHSNEPGWDLLVDGEKYQVKCLSDVSGILEHFEKYDYPVIANEDLKSSLPDALLEKVMFIEDYQEPLIDALTWAAVDQSIDLSSSNVPFIAVGMSAGRTLFKWKKGEFTGLEAAKSISADGIVRYLLAASAAGAGTAAGGLLLGPAGALVWGNLLPILAQSQTGKVKFKLRKIRNGILQKIIPALNRTIKQRREIKC